ncbi:hypothetical protein EJF36_02015 [Bacillus sp. HMF5848]|uniref:hypothetical protein n=1 Tax=Bacillus sp. HMF5848 TaxID=2495421 RepID=UPI000F7A9684|nr:hypothetical protein [Bacillus sp. HMF5848]RSK25765.1 hypothetical protein EJF36_02015 [Bacillus sp. HMF5848]
MNKLFLLLAGLLLSVSMLAGCNAGDEAPPPADDDTIMENDMDMDNNGLDNNNGMDNNGINGDMGMDEDGGMMGDDENDANPDREDIIEDPQDMNDANNKDQ